MFTLFAPVLGSLFLLSLLYVMVTECHACSVNEAKQSAPKKIRFKGSNDVFERIVTDATFHNHTKR